MEFKFNVNEFFKHPIVEINQNLVPPGFAGDRRALWDTIGKVSQVVNAMGEASAAAQGLTKPITTSERLRNSEHKVYVLVDQSANNGKGAITGMLKTGRKGLYVFDRDGQHYQVTPPCILDFYIHESRQRTGLGKQLFEHMLKTEQVEPVKLAIDRPSEKFLGFLNKHYSLNMPVKQMNNYVVFDGFFPGAAGRNVSSNVTPSNNNNNSSATGKFKSPSANGLQSLPASFGRYGAPRPVCSMGQIIHNDSSTVKKSQEAAGVRSEPITNYQSVMGCPSPIMPQPVPVPMIPPQYSQSAPNFYNYPEVVMVPGPGGYWYATPVQSQQQLVQAPNGVPYYPQFDGANGMMNAAPMAEGLMMVYQDPNGMYPQEMYNENYAVDENGQPQEYVVQEENQMQEVPVQEVEPVVENVQVQQPQPKVDMNATYCGTTVFPVPTGYPQYQQQQAAPVQQVPLPIAGYQAPAGVPSVPQVPPQYQQTPPQYQQQVPTSTNAYQSPKGVKSVRQVPPQYQQQVAAQYQQQQQGIPQNAKNIYQTPVSVPEFTPKQFPPLPPTRTPVVDFAPTQGQQQVQQPGMQNLNVNARMSPQQPRTPSQQQFGRVVPMRSAPMVAAPQPMVDNATAVSQSQPILKKDEGQEVAKVGEDHANAGGDADGNVAEGDTKVPAAGAEIFSKGYPPQYREAQIAS